MSNELKVAIEAAKAGAKAALKYFDTNPSFELKRDNTPVTKADKETEEIIKSHILQKFPDAKFVGEETGGSLKEDEFWLIDPIDATHNFVRAIPLWGCFIALVRSEEGIVGVSYMPLLDQLLFAEKGIGAYNNGKKIHVSKTKTIKESFLNHSSLKYIIDRLPGFLKLSKMVYKMRGFGDIYGYNLVATGQVDGVIEGGNNPWDVVAIKLIIEEAGGKVSNFKGEGWTFTNDDCIATNGFIHDEVIRILNGP